MNKSEKDPQELIEIQCPKCPGKAMIKRYSYKRAMRKNNGKLCKRCRGKISATNSAKGNKHMGVVNQWKTIRADPEKYKKICFDRVARSKKCWEAKTEEQKNWHIERLTSSHNKSRSLISNELKKDMITAGIENFISEQIFHGYIPDEINHEYKIIVELYGDVYHCNPRIYKDSTAYVTLIQRTVQQQWDRDKKRLAALYRNGYSVIIIWEKDFRTNPKKQIERIQNEIAKKRSLGRTI